MTTQFYGQAPLRFQDPKALGEGIVRTSKEFLPYIKYIDPEERERFLELSKQEQVRDLLLQNLQAIVEVGGGKIIEGVTSVAGGVFRKFFPKTTQNIIKNIDEIKPLKSEGELPKYAGSVNLKKQAIDEEAKRIELDLWNEYGIKTKMTREQMIGNAQKVIKKFKEDPTFYQERISKIQAGATPTIEEELAHRMLNAENFQNFVDLSKRVAAGEVPKETLDNMQAGIAKHYMNITQPLASQSGRRLSMYNIEVGKNRAFKAIGQLGKKLNKRQLKELSEVNWEDPHSVNEFITRLPDPKLKDYFYEFWYNSILSGIPTHVVNATSNTLWRLWQIPHRALTAGLDSVIAPLTGRARERLFREVVPLMAGEVRGLPKAVKNSWRMFRHGRLTEVEDKWAKEMGSIVNAFDRAPNPVVRGVGKVVTIPTKALRSMDVFANSIAYDSQLRAIAKRSKKPIKEFVTNPPEWAHKEAIKYAQYTTFMDEPGKISSWIMRGREVVPGLRLVIPFVNTIGNLMKRGIEMTPGVGLTLAKGQPASEVIAKQIEGAIIAFAMMDKVRKGDLTGDVPDSPNEREAFYRQGKLPWAIKVGDTYYQYRRVEPFNTPLAMIANAYDEITNAKDEDTATDIFWNTVNGVKNHVLDSSYLQGVTQLLDRHGTFENTIPRMGASLVPFSGFWRSVNRAYEAATEGSAKVYEHGDFIASLAGVLPGLYKLREPRLNVWGEEIELPGNAFRQWLPWKWAKETDDYVEDFLEKLEVYPGLPGQRVKIDGIETKLDDDIYRQYVIDYGVKAKKHLKKMVIKENWQNQLETESGRELLKRWIKSDLDYYRENALIRAKREQLKK